MQLPSYVSTVIDKLNNCGYEAFAVGGCIRDLLLGKTPKDYDITTSAKPEEIKSCLYEYKAIDTGIEFGTVTVISNGHPLEITTYRIDGKYNDNRRPENVEFTSLLSEDLKRRDLTINAMAYNHKTGFVDLFGGRKDLANGIIRAIGNPVDRFKEDGLRIMRALRFASVYNYQIEKNTSDAIHGMVHLLSNIAHERIAVELNKLLCGNCEQILREYNDVFSLLIPEIKACVGFEQHTKYHNKDVYEHIISTVTAIAPVKHLRLAMFFHDMGKPEYFVLDSKGKGHFKGHPAGSKKIAEKFLKEYKYDNDTINAVVELVSNHDITIINDKKQIKRYLNRFGVERFLDIVAVHIADDKGKAPEHQERITVYEEVIETTKRIVDNKECFSLKTLAVNGNDIISLGYKGKTVGDILQKLLEKVIDGYCSNNYSELIEEAKKDRRWL